MSHSIGWDDRLSVTATDKNLIGHVGAVLLRKCADKAGLTSGLNTAIPRGEGPGWWDRGTVLTSLAVSIAFGATSVSDIDLLAIRLRCSVTHPRTARSAGAWTASTR